MDLFLDTDELLSLPFGDALNDLGLDVLVELIWHVYVLATAEPHVREVDKHLNNVFFRNDFVVTQIKHLEDFPVKLIVVRPAQVPQPTQEVLKVNVRL